MTNELREFVYLDTMGVNSLLASQFMAIPETVRDVSEEIEGDDDQRGIRGSLGIQGIGNIGGEWMSGSSEELRNLAEIERRINDQYRFSILHKTLEEAEQLIDLSTQEADNETSFELDQGEVIKAKGNCDTDPFYRLLSAVSLMMRIGDAQELVSEEGGETNPEELEMDEMTTESGKSIFEAWRDILHGERIGLKLEPEEFRYPIIMSVGQENLWVNPEREFLGSHDYVVVGRVSQTISGREKWDFIDLLRIVGSVFSEEAVDSFREALLEVGDNLGDIENDGFQFDVEIDRDDYVVEEPAIVVDPIAIYW